MHQADEPLAQYQIEHIISRQHGGSDHKDNLALSCPNCNRHKGHNLSGVDPKSKSIVKLFHPRLNKWNDHFRFSGPLIIGKTEMGRATVFLLGMNGKDRIDLRSVNRR